MMEKGLPSIIFRQRREGAKGGGEKPRAGGKNPKAVSTQCSSADPVGGLLHGVHLTEGVLDATGGLVNGATSHLAS